jgi:hypothetical protein
VRVIMTGLDWKSAFTSAVIRPCFMGMGASPKRHWWGKIFILGATETDGRLKRGYEDGEQFLRRDFHC